MGKKMSDEDFVNQIDSCRAWRRQELSRVKMDIESLNAEDGLYEQNVRYVLRRSYLMLYAHWEGYIKEVGQKYTKSVSKEKIQYRNASDVIVASSLKTALTNLGGANTHDAHIDFVNKFRDLLSDGKYVDRKYVKINEKIIDAKSNLNYELFIDILKKLDIVDNIDDKMLPSEIESLKTDIDTNLLKVRNEVAHGEKTMGILGLKKNIEEYLSLHDRISKIMYDFSEWVIDAWQEKRYLKH